MKVTAAHRPQNLVTRSDFVMTLDAYIALKTDRMVASGMEPEQAQVMAAEAAIEVVREVIREPSRWRRWSRRLLRRPDTSASDDT